MFIVTALSYDELSTLIRDKKVSLDNGALLFGQQADLIDGYFRERIGYSGYVVGLRGRLNPTTAKLFAGLDKEVEDGNRLILEAEIDKDDMMRFNVEGVTAAANALAYGLDEQDVCTELDKAMAVGEDETSGVEVICVPYIKANGKVRITSLVDDITFNVEGITFVKMR